jgi:hypothetical protein
MTSGETARFQIKLGHCPANTCMSVEPRSPDQPSEPPSGEPLQFDKAEFSAAPALSCAFCKAPIKGEYFQVNGQSACSKCRAQIETAIAGGSKIARALRALGAGIAAAIGGFLIYWAIRAATGYEFALVAILVGWMVGVAVRWGCHNRGGKFYQLMAVVLTYFSIASTYCPDIIQGLRQGRAEARAAAQAEPPQERTGVTTNVNAASAVESSANTDSPSSLVRPAIPPERNIPLWFEIVFAFCISLAAPFLMGFNILGWIIIAVGLMQAWRLNRRVPVEISGPYQAGAAGATSQS